jgi:hypothetical protein
MVTAISLTLQAIGQTANALIRRSLGFKKIQIISLTAYSVGYLAVGLPLAEDRASGRVERALGLAVWVWARLALLNNQGLSFLSV